MNLLGPKNAHGKPMGSTVHLMSDLQRVVGARHLQNLGQTVDVHPQRHRTVALEPEKRSLRSVSSSVFGDCGDGSPVRDSFLKISANS